MLLVVRAVDSAVADDPPLACDDRGRGLVVRGCSAAQMARGSRETTMEVLVDVQLIKFTTLLQFGAHD